MLNTTLFGLHGSFWLSDFLNSLSLLLFRLEEFLVRDVVGHLLLEPASIFVSFSGVWDFLNIVKRVPCLTKVSHEHWNKRCYSEYSYRLAAELHNAMWEYPLLPCKVIDAYTVGESPAPSNAKLETRHLQSQQRKHSTVPRFWWILITWPRVYITVTTDRGKLFIFKTATKCTVVIFNSARGLKRCAQSAFLAGLEVSHGTSRFKSSI